MAGLLYFIPNKTHAQKTSDLPPLMQTTFADLKGGEWSCGQCDKGPENKAGALITPHCEKGGEQALCLYMPEKQTWAKIGEGDNEYWIGFETARKPRPADLRRKQFIPGNPVKVDEHDWIVPIVHISHMTLPRGFDYDGAVRIDPEYRHLMEQAEKFFDLWYSDEGESDELMLDDCYSYCVDLLAINYRIGKPEACMDVLDLVTTANIWDFVYASLGVPQVMEQIEASKKKLEGTP